MKNKKEKKGAHNIQGETGKNVSHHNKEICKT
jgi:hypothetical protein